MYIVFLVQDYYYDLRVKWDIIKKKLSRTKIVQENVSLVKRCKVGDVTLNDL